LSPAAPTDPTPAWGANSAGPYGPQEGYTTAYGPYGPPAGYAPTSSYAPYGPPPAFAYPPWWAYPPSPMFAPGPPKTAKPVAAGVLWCLLLVRDLGMLALIAILTAESGGRPFPPGLPLSPVSEPITLLLIVGCGLAASTVALVCDLSRSHYAVGTWAGAFAVGASLTPGILLGFGIVGTALGAIALAIHYASRFEFKKSPGLGPYGEPTGP